MIRGARPVLAAIAVAIIAAALSLGLVKLSGNVKPGVSAVYNSLAYLVAPNNLATWVYDWRGFDTLMESVVIYVGAFVAVLALGRGVVKLRQFQEVEQYESRSLPILDFPVEELSMILRLFGVPTALLIMVYAIYVVTGSSTSGGGGFQCGVILSSAYLLAALLYGRKGSPIQFSPRFMVGLACAGLAGYILLGFPGLASTGYFLYNVGADVWHIAPAILKTIFGDPWALKLALAEGTFISSPGIIPLINVSEAFNVIGALTLLYFAFLYGWAEEGSKQ